MKHSTFPEFDKYLRTALNYSPTNVQKIVEFYFWFKKIDRKFDSFKRHLRVAKQIDTWSNGDLNKSYELIQQIGFYFSNRNLEWSLNAVYRNIPKYEKGDLDDHEYKQSLDAESEVELDSKRRLAEFKAEQKKRKKKKPKQK